MHKRSLLSEHTTYIMKIKYRGYILYSEY